MLHTDVLIIGCGIAGASAALQLARNPNRHITIITRASDPHESNTRYAQGGIISRGPDDSVDKLVEDIMDSGAGANLPKAARILAEEGPALLNEILINTAGILFDKNEDGSMAWGKEAAHSTRRILHKSDFTGQAIIDGLLEVIGDYPNITVLNETTAVDLITFPHHSTDPLDAYNPISCHGVYAFSQKERTVHRLLSKATVLASGGLGRIFRSTTNPVGARGDGVAMAHRAGARIVNAE
ncbi:MAG: FAD-dependent oxidoreductase, partial [Chloroflexi bacterium]|nr:FAD-dependent oxidoreductase [Chloroflexota bacterium]